MIKKYLHIISFILFTGLLTGVGFSFFSQKAAALSGADFKPGKIIDDVVFTNKSSMTAAQIQQFLESKVAEGSCDTNGTRASTRWNAAAGRYYTHAEWGALNGNPAPFVCLTTYRENPTTKQTNLGNPTAVIEGSQTAAEIIYNAGQQYNINPQALIVLLQKEQGLVTDDWPWINQYTSATGAYCPDTAACDATKAGFGTQVREAARLFRSYIESPFLYFVGTNNILFNPNRSCGTSVVTIENASTAALYHYTPYQPNAAALANLYGTGDGCSAYGNRNFWRLFNDWFGSTSNPPYTAQLVGVTVTKDFANLPVGEKAQVTYTFKNAGSNTWYKNGPNPVRLGTSGPYDRQSTFCDVSWISCARPAGQNEDRVEPNQLATFTFTIQASTVPQTYYENFNVVSEGTAWMFQNVDSLYINTVPANLVYSVVSSVYPTIIQSFENKTVAFTLRNTGNTTWYKDGKFPVRLATAAPFGRIGTFKNTGWVSEDRPAQLQEASVPPNATGTFTFTYTGPASSQGIYNEAYTLVAESFSWFGQTPIQVSTEAVGSYNASISTVGEIIIPKGEYADITIEAKNTGNTTWLNTPTDDTSVMLVTDLPLLNNSGFCDETWLSCSAVSYANQPTVAANATGTFKLRLKAPNVLGPHPQVFSLYTKKTGKFIGSVVVPVKVVEPLNAWAPVTIQAFSDSTKTTPVSTDKLHWARRVYVEVTAKNTGNTRWFSSGASPVRLATAQNRDRLSLFCDNTWINCSRVTGMPNAVTEPGQTTVFSFWYKAPSQDVLLNESFSVVQENKQWLDTSLAVLPSRVASPMLSWNKVSQYAYTDQTKSTQVELQNLVPGQRVYIGIQAINNGTAPWSRYSSNAMRVGAHQPQDRTSIFCDTTWISCARPSTYQETKQIEPGETASFEFWYTAPSTKGTYNEAFNLVAEGLQWLTSVGASFYTVVK